ncbi:hypothetical protein KP001_17520 [Geomonas subterranea]|uniref:Porin n=1 Tax=Geomonas subterranea TaxID=2847989 RepID=A0ABX8LDT4_9BACT|nr:hypothetical protein [Geomonas subterranea]QXE90198.1 hypothetical protein KP001_17520 [Geomonas subterranea]QXM07676.1 hypothetical protein KP002_11760 [Geomonas subterranea]
MQKKNITMLAAVLAVAASAHSVQAFEIGGANGWKFSTDGFLNVFATYESVGRRPAGVIGGEIGGDQTGTGEAQQQFRVRTGLLPVGVGLNIQAPTTNGVDYAVRLGFYPQVQNNGGSRTDLSPNIDFREINMTATGSFGQILAGRAINLYQAKNILTDMTLFGAGVIGPVDSGPTMGHIGYGYLYPNFGAQIRYTTPEVKGFKVAVSVNDTNDIGAAKIRNVPRLETEISYMNSFTGGKFQAWLSGLYQQASFSSAQTVTVPVTLNPDGSITPEHTIPAVRPGGHVTSLGGAGGVQLDVGGLQLLNSCYGGQALGMLGMQGADALSADGRERTNWGFLNQATYQVNPAWKLGLNYGQSRAELAGNDTELNIQKQQAAVVAVTYNVNKFVQVIGEYTWAQDRWFNGATQDANIGAVGTFIYW